MSVASIIWCDRAPFHAVGNPSEIVQRIQSALAGFTANTNPPDITISDPTRPIRNAFAFFDHADPVTGEPTEGPQFVLNVEHISSIVRHEPACTCGPGSGCSNCPPQRHNIRRGTGLGVLPPLGA